MTRKTPPPGKPEEQATWIAEEEFGLLFSEWKERISRTMDAEEEAAPSRRSVWALVGIKRRGAVLARRLWKALNTEKRPLLYGEIDISLYRDDYHLQTEKAMVLGTEITFRVDGVKVLLVDDVLYTGRTVRAAMDLVLDFGRPRVIALAVLLDRGHRELPIAADIVGKVVDTQREDRVFVRLLEMGEEDGVDLIRSPGG